MNIDPEVLREIPVPIWVLRGVDDMNSPDFPEAHEWITRRLLLDADPWGSGPALDVVELVQREFDKLTDRIDSLEQTLAIAKVGLQTSLVCLNAIERSADGGTEQTGWNECPSCGAADWSSAGHSPTCEIGQQKNRIHDALTRVQAYRATPEGEA
jgi:hypothetical protein